MLPLIVDETKVFVFKFWFNSTIQDGMTHHNELFCRLRTFDLALRSQVYHLGCQLAKKRILIVLTTTPQTCSLWSSLRDPLTEFALTNPDALTLPTPSVPLP